MKNTGSGFRGPSTAAFHWRFCPPGVRRAPGAAIADVDAALAHRGHVGGQVVALDSDEAKPAPGGEEIQKGRPRVAGGRPRR